MLTGETTARAMKALEQLEFDRLLIIQATFTDAEAISDAARRFAHPLAIWAMPEPRTGGRLRLNSFCGLNLASHALGLLGRPFSPLYSDPATVDPHMISELFSERGVVEGLSAESTRSQSSGEAAGIVSAIFGSTVGRIGTRPTGFDTCNFDAGELSAKLGLQSSRFGFELGISICFGITERRCESAHSCS